MARLREARARAAALKEDRLAKLTNIRERIWCHCGATASYTDRDPSAFASPPVDFANLTQAEAAGWKFVRSSDFVVADLWACPEHSPCEAIVIERDWLLARAHGSRPLADRLQALLHWARGHRHRLSDDAIVAEVEGMLRAGMRK